MSSELPRLFLAPHGDTPWTESRQHTGRIGIPLNASGEECARQFGERLRRFSFASVFTSPLQRAGRTCELAGFGALLRPDSPLASLEDFSIPICCQNSLGVLNVLREHHGRWRATQEATL